MTEHKRKHSRTPGKAPYDTDHRVYYAGERFTVLRCVVDKWGTRRVAVVEHELGQMPRRVDPRLKSIKHICKVWQFGIHTRKGWAINRRAMPEAKELAEKLDRLWPMHFAAKELRGRVLYVGHSRKPGELKWLIHVMGKLLPRSQQWLLEAGLIRIETDGTINLTELGHKEFKLKGVRGKASIKRDLLWQPIIAS